MAALRRFDVDELLNRPGTYFNPETEIVLVVDDTAAAEAELFTGGDDEAEWVLVSDEVPIDEHQRDTLLERFQARLTEVPDAEADDLGDEEEELEPDPDPDDDL
jgi:hypothetical protein